MDHYSIWWNSQIHLLNSLLVELLMVKISAGLCILNLTLVFETFRRNKISVKPQNESTQSKQSSEALLLNVNKQHSAHCCNSRGIPRSSQLNYSILHFQLLFLQASSEVNHLRVYLFLSFWAISLLRAGFGVQFSQSIFVLKNCYLLASGIDCSQEQCISKCTKNLRQIPLSKDSSTHQILQWIILLKDLYHLLKSNTNHHRIILWQSYIMMSGGSCQQYCVLTTQGQEVG